MRLGFSSAKGIVKKILLCVLGVGAIGAVGIGTTKLVKYLKNDLKTIHPTFEVGSLGDDGCYKEDKSMLYTKDSFACDGLEVKPDFDSMVSYQLYFYDDLDNFIESTSIMCDSYSGGKHDGYCRILIIPENDNNDKISLTERVKYPSQLTIKVLKKQDIIYKQVYNKRLRVINEPNELIFTTSRFANVNDSYSFVDSEQMIVTSSNLLAVNGKKRHLTINVDFAVLENENSSCRFFIFELSENDGVLKVIKVTESKDLALSENCDYIVISSEKSSPGHMEDYSEKEISLLPYNIKLTK